MVIAGILLLVVVLFVIAAAIAPALNMGGSKKQ